MHRFLAAALVAAVLALAVSPAHARPQKSTFIYPGQWNYLEGGPCGLSADDLPFEPSARYTYWHWRYPTSPWWQIPVRIPANTASWVWYDGWHALQVLYPNDC